MELKKRIVDTPLFVKISCVLLIAAFVINLVAFSTPYWFEKGTYHEGLWSICVKSECEDYSLDNLASKLIIHYSDSVVCIFYDSL